MAQTVREPTLDDGMKALQDLFSRGPTQARVEQHVGRLLASWREDLEPDAYAERLDALRQNLAEGIELTEQGAADVDPAAKAEARQAGAVLASMRTAQAAVQAGELTDA